MASEVPKHIKPTDIRLHQKSRFLEITFEDGAQYHLPCEYLRVYSPSAEVQGHGPGQEVLQLGKETVNIKDIEPVGNYAVILHFDDDHNTGIYSWQLLYSLGKNQASLWKSYLERLEAAGYQRKAPAVQ
ncbi:1-(5-phosphoribosyl)-5-((5-phosphoribosylamino)methylideneamino)imidazole-4-carboxamide isomerase [Gammaproteobacteria bacterium]